MAAVERLAGDVGIKPPTLMQDVPKERQMEALMERLRSKAAHFKSWTENAKALRIALADKRTILDNNERVQLQKCLDSLQKSIKVTSLQSMVERLESISRQLGLKFTAGPTGTDCFISSDMFYVEVLLEATGTVKDVKIAHHGDPVSCPELSEVLSKGDFVEFTRHLEGLSAIYQLNADKKQKSKAYMALQALETDLTMLSQLQSSINDPGNLVHKSPVGILETRRGGHPMKLTYFISPYDLLDLDSKTLIPLSVDAVIEKQLGYSVMVCIESAMPHKLQTQSLMSIARTTDGKSLPSFAAPSNLNSTTLPASFVLRLNTAMPIAVALVRKIQAITHIDCADLSTNQPLLSLITQRASKGEIDSHSGGLFVTLPDQHHCYFMSGSNDLQGTMINSIPFTHPTHVPQILIFLRQQALFNVLVSSCIRPHSRPDLESALMFEISALSWLHISVAFEHPIEESMATAEFDLSDITNVKCKLHTMPNDTPICSDEYASKVVQRCLSVPITMRALIRKAQGQQQQQRFGQTNGDMSINLVSNNGNGGNLLGHPSPFSDGGAGSGAGGAGGSSSSSNKFVADFDVKLNGRNGAGGTDSLSDNAQQPVIKLEPGLSSSAASNSVTSYGGVSAELSRSALDAASGFMDAGGGSAPAPLSHHHHHQHLHHPHQQHSHSTSQSSSAHNTHGNLFPIPPERTGSLTNSTLLGNVLPQAGSQQLPTPSSSSASTSTSAASVTTTTTSKPSLAPLSLTPPTMPQGKPAANLMLMNLLNDIPQGQPLNVGSGVSITASPAVPPPPPPLAGSTTSGLPITLSTAAVKPRKRKRKATTDLSSPRSGGGSNATGPSPKRKPSEDDCGSSSLTMPDMDTGESVGGADVTFDLSASVAGTSFSLVTGGATITTTTTTVAGGVSSFSISGSAADIHALKSSIGDAAFNRFRKSPTSVPGRGESGLPVPPESGGGSLTTESTSITTTATTNRATPNPSDFRIKSEPVDHDGDASHESRTGAPGDGGAKEGCGREFTVDGGTFTISSGSSIKLSASSPSVTSGSSSVGGGGCSSDRSSKDPNKKMKKLKLELGAIQKTGSVLGSGGVTGLGERKDTKEIEKIPIVLDITSACDSGKPSEVTVMRPPSTLDLPDRRPSVEIIPLGSGLGGSSSVSPKGTSAAAATLLHHHHHHSAGLSMYNAAANTTSIKISKSPSTSDKDGKKDVKVKQREMRKMAAAAELFDKKTGVKLESKKERKRKRMEEMLDGMASMDAGGSRQHKIINVVTPGSTTTASTTPTTGHGSLTVTMDSKGVPVVSQQRSGLGLSGLSRSGSTPSASPSHKSPLLSPPLNASSSSASSGLSLNVSKAMTALSAASSIGSMAPSKKSLVQSPTVSPTLTVSPNKSVSILKATHSGAPGNPSKPKPSSGTKPGGASGSGSSGVTKLTSSHPDSGGSTKLESSVNNARVTISPLKVHNKNRQGGQGSMGNTKITSGQLPLISNQLSASGQQQQQQLVSNKLPTRPATVKLKQLNLPPLPTGASCSVSTVPRGASSPTVSSKTSATAALMSLAASNSLGGGGVSCVTTLSGGTSSLCGGAGVLAAGSSPTAALTLTTNTSASSSSSATAGLSLSPSSASKLQAMAQQGNSSAATAAAVAALLAQKASKLAARSRKGSLSAVIDKLMASSTAHQQHTGDVPLPPPSTSEVPRRSDGGGGEKSRPDKRSSDSLSNSFQKSSEGRPPKSGGSGGGSSSSGLSEGKSSSDSKKAEFTVKQSSQGIKLTVTKTHTTEGVTKLSSSLKSSSGKMGRSSSGGGGGNNKSFPGSSTGLKPGVNSGPASKKSSTPPTTVAASTSGTTSGSSTSKSPSGNPGSGQSSKSTSLASPKVSTTSASLGSSSPALSLTTVSSVSSVAPQPPSSVTITTTSSLSSKSISNTSSTAAPSAKLQQSKHQNTETRLPSSSSGGSKSSGSSVGSGSNSSTEGSVRPSTPKTVAAAAAGAMPPPPPPAATADQSTVAAAMTTAAGAAIRKNREDSPLRHSPVRQLSTATSSGTTSSTCSSTSSGKANPRDSPTTVIDESDSERAFQRLLQVQGTATSGSGQIPGGAGISARKPSPSRAVADSGALSAITGANSSTTKSSSSSSSKTDLPERSPKHSGSSSGEGRSTPKSGMAIGSEKSRALSPSVGSFGGSSSGNAAALLSKMMHQGEGKRPITPKLDSTATVTATPIVAMAKPDLSVATTGNVMSSAQHMITSQTVSVSPSLVPTSFVKSSSTKPSSGGSSSNKPKTPTSTASPVALSAPPPPPLPPPPPPPPPQSSITPVSPLPKEIHSPEDRLIIDYPLAPVAHRRSPDLKALAKPATLPPPPAAELPTSGPSNYTIAGKAMVGVVGGGSSSAFSALPPSAMGAVDMRMPPTSPAVVQPLKSPAQPSPMVRSPAVVSTPQSEHSNPSSVAHSSPYDIDDELMDEALVGLGK